MSTQPTDVLTPVTDARQRPRRRMPSRHSLSDGPPPLEPGDHLTRAEFERRYSAHPEIKKAELIQGVVFMPSAVRVQSHSLPHSMVMAWLTTYWASTPGVMVLDNTTLRLDDDNVPQPDALMRLEPTCGGRSHIAADDYLEGPPELVVEIAASSASYDLHAKRAVYERNHVPEYLVLQMHEQRVDWFALHQKGYEPLEPDDAGILRSLTFPGLWLDVNALLAGDLTQMLAVLSQGLDAPEHATFVTKLEEALNAAEP